MSLADRARRADASGLIAAALAVALLAAQAAAMQKHGREQALPVLLWQLMVVLLAAVGAVADRLRLRAALYTLGAVSAVLYGLLSWAFGGVVDVVVAGVLVWGLIRALVADLASS